MSCRLQTCGGNAIAWHVACPVSYGEPRTKCSTPAGMQAKADVERPWWAYGPGGMQLWFPSLLPGPGPGPGSSSSHSQPYQQQQQQQQDIELEFDQVGQLWRLVFCFFRKIFTVCVLTICKNNTRNSKGSCRTPMLPDRANGSVG